MLVLSRRVNETIIIDGQIRVTVLGMGSNRVRLGIEAPEEVNIIRDELIGPDGILPKAGEGPIPGSKRVPGKSGEPLRGRSRRPREGGGLRPQGSPVASRFRSARSAANGRSYRGRERGNSREF
jgi:carbon storage regulator